MMQTSARNRLPGSMTEVKLGGIMAQVGIRVGGDRARGRYHCDSAEELGLRAGDRVFAVIKATEVMLNKEK